MIIRALDADHDWKFGRGKQDYLTKNDAIALNIETRLLSFFNDCFFDLAAGLDWFGFLSRKNTSKEIELNSRAVILQSYGVVQVTSLTATISGRVLSLKYTIDTIYTKQFSKNLEVINV